MRRGLPRRSDARRVRRWFRWIAAGSGNSIGCRASGCGFGCTRFVLCESGGMAVLEKSRMLGFGACALASSLWGCGFFFGKLGRAEMNSAHMVRDRVLVAMGGLVALL